MQILQHIISFFTIYKYSGIKYRRNFRLAILLPNLHCSPLIIQQFCLRIAVLVIETARCRLYAGNICEGTLDRSLTSMEKKKEKRKKKKELARRTFRPSSH